MICDPILSTIEPNMSTNQIPDNLSIALFGKTKRSLLALFFSNPEEARNLFAKATEFVKLIRRSLIVKNKN